MANQTQIIELAIGKHSRETAWKNSRVTWDDLVRRLSKPHRTHETAREYWAMAKEQRDKIKDIGGFVGGYLVGGRRIKGSVIYRTLLTLDVDAAEPGFWDTFQMLYGNAGLIYSTHSHTAEKPRYRLVMPFDRHVEPEEYQPICRRVAGNLGIEQFDNTGFQIERLMYWPSASQDAEYVFECQSGPPLQADKVLRSYSNWREVSEWPVSERVEAELQRSQKKQGDPTEKKGIVGAFCRTYGIEEVIEKYLNDVYERSDIDDRFTYIGGSTSSGLIVYDNMYAYSHHGTDPISGRLCNAFDLVRIHLYGDRDKGIDPDTAPDDLPSYQEMRTLANGDPAVREQIGKERLETAFEDFAAVGVDVDEINTKWMERLSVMDSGGYKSTIDNVVIILENDPMLKGCMAFDAFRRKAMVVKKLPWRNEKDDPLVTDNDESNLRHYIEKVYGIGAATKIRDAMEVILKRTAYHPVVDYLDSLKWDRVKRIDSLMDRCFGVSIDPYTSAAIRKTLVAAVARVSCPGIKFDTVLVLKGAQGLRKSMFIDIMGGEWFSDTFTTVQGKEAYEQLQGHWIIEIAELAGMRKAEVEQIKNFTAKRKDNYRPAYGHNTVEYKRQCIFIGTTNRDVFLHDVTGGRRWWPLTCTRRMTDMVVQWLRDNRDQIWAEAAALWKAGEPLYMSGEVERIATRVQAEHMEDDDRKEMVAEYLDKLIPENWDRLTVWQKREFLNGDPTSPEGTVQRERVSPLDIWLECMGGTAKDYNRRIAREINDLMKTVPGWTYRQYRKNYELVKGFVRESGISIEFEE